MTLPLSPWLNAMGSVSCMGKAELHFWVLGGLSSLRNVQNDLREESSLEPGPHHNPHSTELLSEQDVRSRELSRHQKSPLLP